MEELSQIESRIEALQAAHNEARATQPVHVAREASQALKEAKAELSAAIAGDCKCLTCGNPAQGMRQQVAVRNVPSHVFEVGCVHCKDHRAQGFTVEHARANFEAGPNHWIPPKTAPEEDLRMQWAAEPNPNAKLQATIARWSQDAG